MARFSNGPVNRNGENRMDGSGGGLSRLSELALLVLACVIVFCGCTTKAKAKAEARAAFLAGQQQGLMRQAQAATVTVHGAVKNPVVPWTQDLTVARAIIAADYYGSGDPREIIMVRQGIATRIDPNKLLTGDDPLVQPGDILELR